MRTIFSIIVILAIFNSCALAEKRNIHLALAHLPAGHDGKVSIIPDLETPEKKIDVQLSLNKFSVSVSVFSDKDPYIQYSTSSPPVRLNIPAGKFSVYTLIQIKKDGKLKSLTISEKDWPEGSMLVFNNSRKPLYLKLGKQAIVIKPSKFRILKSSKNSDALAAKIYIKAKNKAKLVFASTWRIAKKKREFCFLSYNNKRAQIKSISHSSPISK